MSLWTITTKENTGERGGKAKSGRGKGDKGKGDKAKNGQETGKDGADDKGEEAKKEHTPGTKKVLKSAPEAAVQSLR